MTTTESDVFSKCYENLCSETVKMVDHSQYPDVLNEGLHKSTGLNECDDFTEENIGHFDSQDNDRENNTGNHIGDVMEMIQIDVKEGQNNEQLNDVDETTKRDYSKNEKTKRCVCEVADDKNVYVNNKLECKTPNGEKDVCPDNHAVRLNKRSAELGNSLPKEDQENIATNKSCIIKGGRISSISRINPHRIHTATEMIENSKTNLTCSFCIPKHSRKEQPENNDGISSTRRPFVESQNFTTHEQHLSIPKHYPHRMSSSEYRISVVDMSYNRSEGKTIYPPRRISESKVSVPLRCRSVSYLENYNNSANLKYKRYGKLRDSLELARSRRVPIRQRSHFTAQPQYVSGYHHDIIPRDSLELARLRGVPIERGRHFTAQPPSRYASDYYMNVEPQVRSRSQESRPSREKLGNYFLQRTPKRRGSYSTAQPQSSRYVSEYHHDVIPPRTHGAALRDEVRSPRYVSNYYMNVKPHGRSRSQQDRLLQDEPEAYFLPQTPKQRGSPGTAEAQTTRYISEYHHRLKPKRKPPRKPPRKYKSILNVERRPPRYVSEYYMNVEPHISKQGRSRSQQSRPSLGELEDYFLQLTPKRRSSYSTAQPQSSRYVPEYHHTVTPTRTHGAALRDEVRSPRYASDYYMNVVSFDSEEDPSILDKSRPSKEEVEDYFLQRAPKHWRYPDTEQPHTSRYVPGRFKTDIEQLRSSFDDERSERYSPLLDTMEEYNRRWTPKKQAYYGAPRSPTYRYRDLRRRSMIQKATKKVRDTAHKVMNKLRAWAPERTFSPVRLERFRRGH